MVEVCFGPTTEGIGCMIRSTPPEAASAVEMEMNDFGDEDSASSGGLVVRVREVVPGGLELTLTIGDANGDYPEVSRANTMRDANHPVCTQEVRR
eukprot:scaffold16101_cov32-Phaeocystis_antarctica.AAC.1